MSKPRIVLLAINSLAWGALQACPAYSQNAATAPQRVTQASWLGNAASNPALEYFTGARPHDHATSAMSRTAPQTPPTALPTDFQSVQRRKPFSGYAPAPSVSPYLALDLPTTDSALPNYYAFVQPRLEQQEQLRVQQAQLQQLQKQLRNAPSTAGGADATGPNSYQSRFMNSGQFYQGIR